MKTPFRKSALVAAAVALTLTTAACESDTRPSAGDVLANDSTLALAVLGAQGDSVPSTGFGDTISPAEPIDAEPVESTPDLNVSSAASPGITPAPGQPMVARVEQAPAPARRSAVASRRRSPGRQPARRAVAVSRRGTSTRTVSAPAAQKNSPSVRTSDRTVLTGSTPARMWVTLASGSELELESTQQVCANTSAVGDVFGVTVTEPVVRANGTLIPSGATAQGEVISVSGSEARKGAIGVRISSITFDGRTYPVSSRVTYTESKLVKTGRRSGSAGTVVTGAGLGAILGGVVGRDAKAAVIGAAGGAAAGAVLASRTTGRARCLPDGGRITAQLVEPLRIQL